MHLVSEYWHEWMTTVAIFYLSKSESTVNTEVHVSVRIDVVDDVVFHFGLVSGRVEVGDVVDGEVRVGVRPHRKPDA